nr:H:ACA ribonucleoprotein complex subunit 4 [Hymenolepis microstoma]
MGSKKKHVEKESADGDSTNIVSVPTKVQDDRFSVLLKNVMSMNSNGCSFAQEIEGCSPTQRAIQKYIDFGVINLDKPSNPSSHEVVAWVKNILQVEKTGHSGTLDPKVSGCLIVCIEKATRLVKSQQNAGKGYISICRLHGHAKMEELKRVCEQLEGSLYQRPPLISAVKRNLRIRSIKDLEILEFDEKRGLAILEVNCQAGTYIRTLCVHIGLMLGVGGVMEELRRVRSGVLTEYDNMVTMHDVLDAYWMYLNQGDERYLRKIIMPLENILVNHKRIIVKDSAVAALCFGAALCKTGIIYFDNDIQQGEEIVLVTSKGEAIALATARCNTEGIAISTYGFVAKLKRVIMERDHYRRQWIETRKKRKEREAAGLSTPGAVKQEAKLALNTDQEEVQVEKAPDTSERPKKRPRNSDE